MDDGSNKSMPLDKIEFVERILCFDTNPLLHCQMDNGSQGNSDCLYPVGPDISILFYDHLV